MKILVTVSVTDMSLQIYRYQYRQKYRLAEYIGIGIGWTHIGLTLDANLVWLVVSRPHTGAVNRQVK